MVPTHITSATMVCVRHLLVRSVWPDVMDLYTTAIFTYWWLIPAIRTHQQLISRDAHYMFPINLICSHESLWIALIDGVSAAEPVEVLPARVPERVPRQEPSRAGIVVAVRQAQKPRLRVRVVPKLPPELERVVRELGLKPPVIS